jgi:response regulator NasT
MFDGYPTISATRRGVSLPNNRLLLVDDDRLALATLAQGLRNVGYVVIATASGDVALAEASSSQFDLAVLDIRMPGISGIAVGRELKARHGIHSLFLTAFSDQELVQEAIHEGGLGYVIKPIDALRLAPAVETALARARDLESLFKLKSSLEQALATGRNTSMAIGILMERCGIPEQAAFVTLRNHARRERRKLEDYCRDFAQTRGHKS